MKLNAYEKKLLEWSEDPVLFVREALKVEPDLWQANVLRDVCAHNRVAVRSCNGAGKSAELSWIILWWLLTHRPAKVICTSPSANQMESVLWSELAIWRNNMDEGFRELVNITMGRASIAGGEAYNFAVARTARKENPEALQGFHSPNQLIIVDEASGVDDVIFQVGSGSMSTPGSKTVMMSNPTRTSGYFYNAFHGRRTRWKCHHVNFFDLIERKVAWADPGYPDEIADDYGRESNVYRVRVLGEFPTSEDDVLIPLHLVEEATRRNVQPTGRHLWGLDPARFGDDRTALCKRRGNVIREPVKFWRQKNTMQVAGLVKLEYDDARLKPDEIMIDSIGIGAGVYDRLKEQGLPVRSVNVAESAAVKDRFVRLRDELWWSMREWFESQSVAIPDDPGLMAELTAVKYEPTSAGKIKVESKDDMKARGLMSPDLADSLMITFAAPASSSFFKPIKYKDNAYYV